MDFRGNMVCLGRVDARKFYCRQSLHVVVAGCRDVGQSRRQSREKLKLLFLQKLDHQFTRGVWLGNEARLINWLHCDMRYKWMSRSLVDFTLAK